MGEEAGEESAGGGGERTDELVPGEDAGAKAAGDQLG